MRCPASTHSFRMTLRGPLVVSRCELDTRDEWMATVLHQLWPTQTVSRLASLIDRLTSGGGTCCARYGGSVCEGRNSTSRSNDIASVHLRATSGTRSTAPTAASLARSSIPSAATLFGSVGQPASGAAPRRRSAHCCQAQASVLRARRPQACQLVRHSRRHSAPERTPSRPHRCWQWCAKERNCSNRRAPAVALILEWRE